jgi:hypothetical protein
MIAEVKGARLLQRFRGRPAAELKALEDILGVSYFAMQMEGHLAELGINRLMVLPPGQGVKAVDALVRYRVNWRQFLCRSIFGLPAASRTGISLEGEAFAALLAPTAHPLVAESRIG